MFLYKEFKTSPPEIKLKFKNKSQVKVMLYMAISSAGVTEPYFKPSGLPISKEVYQNK